MLKREVKDEIKPEQIEPLGYIWNDPYGPYLPMVYRVCWGALEPKSTEPLAAPIHYIRFCTTGTDMTLFPQCREEMQELQKDHMDLQGLPDIAYNFMIGVDGTIYEGRGWKVEADRPEEFQAVKKKCLDIAYVGDFQDMRPNWLMINTGLSLIKYGIKGKLIDPLFETIQYDEHSFTAC